MEVSRGGAESAEVIVSAEDRRFPTWQWLVGVLLFILFATASTLSAIAAYSYKDTQRKIETDRDYLEKKLELKADRDDFDRMYNELRDFRKEVREEQKAQREMLTSHINDSGFGRISERRKK